MTPALLAASGAIGIAIFAAVFGVGVARLLWAEDLTQARSIDAIRSRTEESLRSTIESDDRILESKDEIIAILKRRLGESP